MVAEGFEQGAALAFESVAVDGQDHGGEDFADGVVSSLEGLDLRALDIDFDEVGQGDGSGLNQGVDGGHADRDIPRV